LYPKELRLSLIQSIQLLPPLICSPENIYNKHSYLYIIFFELNIFILCLFKYKINNNEHRHTHI
jgi:1-acyl-sn-glycerol-3-phosphate acyltransferase